MEVRVPQRSLTFLCLLFLGLSHLITATTGQSQDCSRGFDTFSLPEGDGDDRRRKRQGSRAIHYIVPYMNFSCDGTIDKIEFAASHAEEVRGTVEFEVWRPSASSSGTVTLYALITDATYTRRIDDGGYRTGTISPSFTVSSGDILGIFVHNSRTLNVGTTSIGDDDFLVYRLKDGSGTTTTANIPSSYDSSSNFSPLVTVSFVPYPTESSDLTTEAVISSTPTEVSSSANPISSNEVSPSTDSISSTNLTFFSTKVSSSANPRSSAEVSSSTNPSSPTEVSLSTNPSSSTKTSSSTNLISSTNPSSTTELSSSAYPSSFTEVSSSVASTSFTGKDSSSTSTSVHYSIVPGTDDEVLGNLESGNGNVGVIVGAVLGGIVLVVIAIVLVGAVVFLLYPRGNKERQYITFARFRRETADVQLVRMRRQNITSTGTLDSLALAEYDDPDAYIQTMPQREPLLVTVPPLPPSNGTKEVYETVQQQDDGSLVVVNPRANTSGYEVVVRQEDPVRGVVLTADGPSALYDTITDGGQPLQIIYESIETQYHYVPNENSRKQGTLTRPPSGLEDELRSIYGGVTKTEFENQPFVSPGKELNTIYGQLADKKCIEIPRSFLKQETVLGTGEFGDVFKGVWDTPYGPQDVAIKMLKVGSKEKDKVNFLKEAALMGQFRHPNVIRLLGAVTVDDPCMIVLEFLPRGDLEKHLRSQQPEPGVLPEATLPSQLLQFCCDIAGGMKYLSNKGFVHRDLAARNILLDKNLKCKIADFGLSKTLQSDSEYYIAKGGRVPVRWTPPEALFYKKYTSSSDVWSYGMVMYEIWSLGEKPFRDIEAMNVVKILRNNGSYVQTPPPGCPRDMYRLMVYCWDHNHHNRPNFNAIHSVLSGPADSLLMIPNDDLQQTKDPLKAGQLGMPLEFGKDLYTDLQRYYNADNA